MPHPKVAWVRYPGLESDPYHKLAMKYMPNGTCGVISLGVQGGREAASKFMAGLKLASIATHVADAKTCVAPPRLHHPPQMTDQELHDAGISPDLVRLSVGIEDIADIWPTWSRLWSKSSRKRGLAFFPLSQAPALPEEARGPFACPPGAKGFPWLICKGNYGTLLSNRNKIEKELIP